MSEMFGTDTETETEAARPDLDLIEKNATWVVEDPLSSSHGDFMARYALSLVAYCRRLEQEKADLLQMLAESTARREKAEKYIETIISG